MKKDIAQVLDSIAQKLDTTAEYLWRVLVKQAFVSSITDLLTIVLVIVLTYVAYRLHRWLMADLPDDNYNDNRYEKYESGAAVPMVLLAFFLLFTWLFIFFSIPSIVNGFFNPEYWALEKVLDKIN